MSKKWIKESGSFTSDGLSEAVSGFIKNDDATILAFYTHSFKSGKGRHAGKLCEDAAHLLEMRILCRNSEMWLHRSNTGEPFSYRIANEEEVSEDCYIKKQLLLDIDSGYNVSDETNEYDCLLLRTTVGGRYALPITRSEKYARIVTYIAYDECGRASAADYRFDGFYKEAL